MQARRLTLALGKQLHERSRPADNALAQAARGYSVDHEKRWQKWVEKEEEAVTPKAGDEQSKRILWFPTSAAKETDFSLINIGKWYKHQLATYSKITQQFQPERHDILGADLATAHFLVSRGGRIKFRGHDHWVERDEKGAYDLPGTYNPNYVLEEADASGVDLYYEGLSNLCGLTRLRWLSLKGCRNIDDWGLDKISAEFPKLEHLDISECERITERGLECLYRMAGLKKLVVTNHHGSVALELSCFMLEDCIPGLTCEILPPEGRPKD
ncbi:PREDICTED: ATP synthase subunit s-like protein [Vollenhovia emeryi]|uniref:ATP synthase subunit s-like protein n=1 Tax=Vollenhovia emeryi TaxID=411798 RepID=UPI0005F47642|nr:PREDICTED: ATP synthase subunit s-like protein [Vollenhovia emeryi]